MRLAHDRGAVVRAVMGKKSHCGPHCKIALRGEPRACLNQASMSMTLALQIRLSKLYPKRNSLYLTCFPATRMMALSRGPR